MTRPGGKRSEYVTAALTPEQYAFVQALADQRLCGLAKIVRWAIQEAMEEQKRSLAAKRKQVA